MIFGKTILIIEDEPDLLEMLEFQFTSVGYRVVTAYNGFEGLQKLRTIQPDLIILDLNMPRMGGIEFYQRICDADGRPRYPIVIMTARASTRELFNKFEVAGFMSKPVDIDQLAIMIEDILKKQERMYQKVNGVKKLKRVLIVEDGNEPYDEIAAAFSNTGYTVYFERSGRKALERIAQDPPDLVLVKLGLKDISGDLIALQLKMKSRTTDVRTIVYVLNNHRQQPVILENISYKSGIVELVRYNDPTDLLSAVDNIFDSCSLEYR